MGIRLQPCALVKCQCLAHHMSCMILQHHAATCNQSSKAGYANKSWHRASGCTQAVIPGALNHYFVPVLDPVYKFELGGPSHEACAGVLGIGQYLQTMAGRSQP